MATEIFVLTAILTVTLIVVLVGKLFRQPPIIGYILAGVMLGPTLFGLTEDIAVLRVLSELGIAFLLFIVGINMDLRTVRRVGKVALVAGIGQVLFTSLAGFFITSLLGYSFIEALLISVAFAFSSTILCIKLLSDQKALDRLYGKISIGILIVQDILAVLALLIVPVLSAHKINASSIVHSAIEVVILAFVLWIFGKFLLKKILSYAGQSSEILFLFAITWCFAIASLFRIAGFSLEIGALIAGFLLASTQYSYEISSRVKPLRDFFITLFFIILGAQLDTTAVVSQIPQAIILSLFVSVGNLAIITWMLGLFGFTKKTSFFVGTYLSQISEFSLILIALGASMGLIGNEILSLATVVALLTFAISTHVIIHAEGIFHKIERFFPHKKRGKSNVHTRQKLASDHEVVLFGHNRMGYSIAQHFLSKEKRLLVVDFNPDVVNKLQAKNIDCILGDAGDAELFEELRLGHLKTVVSTITELETNLLIAQGIRKQAPDVHVILSAAQPEDALTLYEEGADYVIIPHVIGGEHAAVMLDLAESNIDEFLSSKHAHMELLKKRDTTQHN